jgi:putative copper resistance protein D
MSTDIISALVRASSFLVLFQAAGMAIFVAIFGHRLTTTASAVRQTAFVSAILGIVLVTAHYGLEAARMAGDLSGAFDLSLQRLVFDSPVSTAWMLRSIGLALVAASIRREGKLASVLGVIGALVTVVAFSFVGHTATDSDRVWLVALLSLHLAVVAFWFGALAPLFFVSRAENAIVATEVVEGFSRIALWLVPAIFLAGVVMTALLVDRWAVFGESYGMLLLLKSAIFAALMGLAALNKWRYGPALSTKAGAVAAFQRTVTIEYGLIGVVLVATAFMTTFFSPEH